jgi:hypothetical protein
MTRNEAVERSCLREYSRTDICRGIPLYPVQTTPAEKHETPRPYPYSQPRTEPQTRPEPQVDMNRSSIKYFIERFGRAEPSEPRNSRIDNWDQDQGGGGGVRGDMDRKSCHHVCLVCVFTWHTCEEESTDGRVEGFIGSVQAHPMSEKVVGVTHFLVHSLAVDSYRARSVL